MSFWAPIIFLSGTCPRPGREPYGSTPRRSSSICIASKKISTGTTARFVQKMIAAREGDDGSKSDFMTVERKITFCHGVDSRPLSEWRCAHLAGLHRDVSEVRGGDGLLVAISAEHGDDRDHDRSSSPRWTSGPMRIWLADALSRCSRTGSDGEKTLSYVARASRIRRARSRSDFGTNRITSPVFLLSLYYNNHSIC